MVIAWLVKKKKLSLWDAYRYVKARRRIVNPNNNFLFQLTQYEVNFFFFVKLILIFSFIHILFIILIML